MKIVKSYKPFNQIDLIARLKKKLPNPSGSGTTDQEYILTLTSMLSIIGAIDSMMANEDGDIWLDQKFIESFKI
jgi:hypothetical protein